MYEEPKITPLKIEIERNTSANHCESEENPFFVTINGNRLSNVKRIYLDLNKDKLFEKDNSNVTYIKPWTWGIEYEDFPYDIS